MTLGGLREAYSAILMPATGGAVSAAPLGITTGTGLKALAEAAVD